MSEALKEILKLITSVQFGGVSRLDLKPRDQGLLFYFCYFFYNINVFLKFYFILNFFSSSTFLCFFQFSLYIYIVYKSIEELDDEGKLVAFVNDGDLKNLADFTLKTAQTSLV